LGRNWGEPFQSAIEAMADGAGKAVAQKEVSLAQAALLSGKIGQCATRLSKAMQGGTAR
jgi:hypothetical protein